MSFTEYLNKAVRYLRPFHWMNVEVTSRCNLQCTMCPRRSFEASNQDMSRELFLKLSDDFKLFRMIDLTGWGEPLLHPDFFEFVRIAKSKRCRVKYVSNGVAFNKDKADETIKTGVDWIVFSVDSPENKTYREIRGADLEKVSANIRYLSEIKKKKGLKYPLIDIAIVISKKNIEELPDMVRFAKDLGANRFLVNNLHVITKKEDIDALLYRIDPAQTIDEHQRDHMVDDALKIASELNIPMSLCFNSFEPKPLSTCTLNLNKTMFISARGDVSPCCDLGHPVPGYLDRNNVIKNTELVFGNIKNNSIMEIFNSKPYTEFRGRILSGIPDECRHCMLIRGI
ncbi:MAG: radical SAM protein [Elusimicrobia bacterium]|nr:radical SAM protein [Elusimicrobiota bacterium]